MASSVRRAASRALVCVTAVALCAATATLGVAATAGTAGASGAPGLGSSYNVATIAGTGSAHTGGDGGPSYDAALATPEGIAVDASGDVAIATPLSGRVRFVAATTGAHFGISMTAGDIYTVATSLGHVSSVTFNRTGDLIIADPTTYEVYEITTAGTESVIAGTGSAPTAAPATGTAATSAAIEPEGVAVDPATGDVLVADRDGSGGSPTVRVVASSSGTYFGVARTAGDISDLVPPMASYGAIDGIAVDPANGDVLWSVGAGTGGQVVDLDPASSGTLYGLTATAHVPVVIAGTAGVTNTSHDVATGAQDGVGARSATLDGPDGLAVDAAHNVLIADGGDAAVRAVAFATTSGAGIEGVRPSGGTVAGDIYTVAGTGTHGAVTQDAAATASAFGTLAGVAVTGSSVLLSDATHDELDELSAPSAPGAAPPGLKVTPEGGGTALATWQPVPVTSEGFDAPAGYTLRWSTCTPPGNCAAGSATVRAPATSASVGNLLSGAVYAFTVSETNAVGTGPTSTPVDATGPAASTPGPVTGVTESGSSGEVVARWSPPSNDGGSPLTGYGATISPCSTGCTQTLGAAATSATFTGLTDGDTYSIALAAENSYGQGPSTSVMAEPIGPPGAPSITGASPSDGAVALTWSVPASDGGLPVSDYEVVRTGSVVVDTGSTATSATVSGLVNFTSYAFTVVAVNAAGDGPPSATVEAAPVSSPSAPGGVTAVAVVAGAAPAIDVTWTDPAANGTTVRGYTLTAIPASGGSPAVATARGATATSGSIVGGLAPGVSYDVTVAADFTGGTGPAWAPVAVTTAAPPAAPTGLVATPALDGTGDILLTWGAASTGGSPVTGYTVRAGSGTGTSGLPLTAGAVATSAVVPGADLTPGHAYTFTVSAANALGAGPTSAPSAPATPATAPGAPVVDGASATAGADGSVSLTWAAPAANGAPITSYTVSPSPGCGGCGGLVATGDPAPTSATIVGLAAGTSYRFTVTATNEIGTSLPSTASDAVTPLSPPVSATPAPPAGYWITTAAGDVYGYGGARLYGSASLYRLDRPIVAMAATPDHRGYWQVGGDGGVFSFGDARFYGSTGNLALARPIVGMAPTADGGGYWLVGGDGGVFSFGDAAFFGSLPGIGIHVDDIVGIVPTTDGQGYWLVGADGGVFSFGDASFFGSLGGSALASPVVGLAATGDGGGYWLVAQDGALFSEGDAPDEGSPAGTIPGQTVVGITAAG